MAKKAKVKFKTVKNDFPKMSQSVKALDGKRIDVGVMGENAWLAGIHEYGCRIKVTDKMRAWLHANGLHLKKETKEIVIPERSFLRNGFDECRKDVTQSAARLIPIVLDGNMSAERLLVFIRDLLVVNIKNYVRESNMPANHPFTIERKGSEKPLVDTGNLIESIVGKVE